MRMQDWITISLLGFLVGNIVSGSVTTSSKLYEIERQVTIINKNLSDVFTALKKYNEARR